MSCRPVVIAFLSLWAIAGCDRAPGSRTPEAAVAVGPEHDAFVLKVKYQRSDRFFGVFRCAAIICRPCNALSRNCSAALAAKISVLTGTSA